MNTRIVILFLLALCNAPALADNWSEAPNSDPRGWVGEDVAIPFRLIQDAAGISGHLTYDPDKFSNPRITTDPSQLQSLIVLGQTIEPGKFRFVIYTNPLAPLNLNYPIAGFLLQVDTADSIDETVSFTQNRASADDLLFQTVDFVPVTIVLNQNGVRDWYLFE